MPRVGKIYQGTQCKYGHDGRRYQGDRHCVQCELQRSKIKRERSPEKYAEWQRLWRLRHPGASAEVSRRHNEKFKEQRNARKKEYRKRNMAKYSALQMKRHTGMLKRTPAWADFQKIEAFYLEAARLTKETGVKHEVDHIIPLQGKTVSGLHVHQNLQILTASENRRKNNRFEQHFVTV